MMQRTKGRLLIALLVITGLAGTLRDTTLTSEERKGATTQLKDSKAKIVRACQGLTNEQLLYRPATAAWNIQDCMTHIALAEKEIWTMMEKALKQPSNPGLRDSIRWKDEEIIKKTLDRSSKQTAPDMLQPARAPWTTTEAALSAFKSLRNDHIKYVRTTTEDLRNHVVPMPFGYLDCYQMLLVLNAHSQRHLAQIEAIKASPGFPAP